MYMNIEAERARIGLSQDEFAEKLGVTRKTYYAWQSKEDMPASKLLEMSRLFNCSIDYLLGLTQCPQIQQKVS